MDFPFITIAFSFQHPESVASLEIGRCALFDPGSWHFTAFFPGFGGIWYSCPANYFRRWLKWRGG
jgi:hypothetical protein